MLIIKFLSGVAFVGSVAWFIVTPDYEPAIAVVTSLSALIAAWLHSKKQEHHATQSQVIAKNGVGIQATGNVTTSDIRVVNHGAKDAE